MSLLRRALGVEEGHVTGHSVLRLVPDNGEKKATHRSGDSFSMDEYRASRLPGYPLDIPYVGMAPWVEAVYCTACKKAICQLDLIMEETEGAK